jgi:hypothetical protein
MKTLPSWRHFVWTDAECRAFIHAHFPPAMGQAYDLCAVGVMRADLWRYLILYWYGGLYVDMKTTIVRKPTFPAIPKRKPRVFTSFWDRSQVDTFHSHLFRVGELQQFWIAAEPGSPVLWRVACQVAANIFALHRAPTDMSLPFISLPKVDSIKSRILSTTGPVVYTYVVAQELALDAASVVILDCNCQQSISYLPPNRRETPSRQPDHYSTHRGSLVWR